MMTDAAFAQLAAATYTVAPTITGQGFDQSISVVLGADPDNALDLIGFPGSRTEDDWARDFEAIPAKDHKTVQHASLGWVHAGFLAAAMSVYPQIKGAITRPSALYGHSLGGALALLVGALLRVDGVVPVERIVTFGAPRVGLDDYVRALEGVAIDQYRYGNDIVPQVPTFLMHARPLINVGAPRIDFLSCHHITNYVGAVTALDAAAA